jgi:hypothetical protein
MTVDPPAVISRYLIAANEQNPEALAACFTEDGTVLDEGNTYTGRDEIIAWRHDTNKWTYTTELTSSESISPEEYRITVHLEGDFPGGVVDLNYKFVLRDGLIAALSVVA